MNSISVGVFLTVTLCLHCVCADGSSSDSNQQIEGNNDHGHHRHRHHHRHHHSNNDLEESGSGDSPDFVAAYRATEAPAQQEGEDGEGDEGGSSNLESRLESLEQDVRHLCLEDEEDVERRIKALGVKCICPKTEAPVCGSDNLTYYNRCYLQCRAQQAEMGYHRYKITLKKFGRC